MRAKELIEVLKDAFKNIEQILVVGEPGIGKTAIIKKACEEIGADLVVMHPAVSDPTDFKGLPSKSNDGTFADFLPFGEIKKLINADPEKITVCFIDDLGQSSESVQKALMQLLLGRRLNNHKLSDKVVFCGATNDVNQRSGVTGLIEPVKSRFDSIVHLEVHLEDWTEWAIQNQIPSEVIAFLRSVPGKLNAFEPSKDLKNSPCPRTWESVAKRIKRGVINRELISGAIGSGACHEFLAFLEMAKEAPSLDDIISNPETARIPEKPSLLFLVASGLAQRADEKNISQIFKYLKRMKEAFRVLCIKDATLRNKKIMQTQVFTNWVMTEGKEIYKNR